MSMLDSPFPYPLGLTSSPRGGKGIALSSPSKVSEALLRLLRKVAVVVGWIKKAKDGSWRGIGRPRALPLPPCENQEPPVANRHRRARMRRRVW